MIAHSNLIRCFVVSITIYIFKINNPILISQFRNMIKESANTVAFLNAVYSVLFPNEQGIEASEERRNPLADVLKQSD